MVYSVLFHVDAQKEWRKLGAPIREQLKKKLLERQSNPHVPAARLKGTKSRYKIKLRASGYRLVYEVKDDVLLIMVIAVGKRNRSDVYDKANKR